MVNEVYKLLGSLVDADAKYQAYMAQQGKIIAEKQRLEAEMSKIKGNLGDLDSRINSSQGDLAVNRYKEVVEEATKAVAGISSGMNSVGSGQ
jgi:peptidoglycan hydrolase CwlO-like protein